MSRCSRSRSLCWAFFFCALALAVPGGAARSQTFEVGSTNVSTNWTSVLTSGTYSAPVVVASLATTTPSLELTLQIRNVTSNVFEMRLVAPSTAFPPPIQQVAGWLVVESGTHTIGDTTIAAGTVSADSLIGTSPGNFVPVTLPTVFPSSPAVLGATQTLGSVPGEFLVTRVRNVTPSSFEIGFQREELNYLAPHGIVTLGWIAWETGTGTVGGWIASAAVTPDTITSTPSTYTIAGFEAGTNLAEGSIFGTMNRFDGADPSWVGGSLPSGTSVDLQIVEETSSDSETSHSSESVALVAFAPAPAPSVPAMEPWGAGVLIAIVAMTGLPRFRRVFF